MRVTSLILSMMMMITHTDIHGCRDYDKVTLRRIMTMTRHYYRRHPSHNRRVSLSSPPVSPWMAHGLCILIVTLTMKAISDGEHYVVYRHCHRQRQRYVCRDCRHHHHHGTRSAVVYSALVGVITTTVQTTRHLVYVCMCCRRPCCQTHTMRHMTTRTSFVTTTATTLCVVLVLVITDATLCGCVLSPSPRPLPLVCVCRCVSVS